MKASDPPIIVEETFAVPLEQLWFALTEKEQMTKWFFEQINEFEPEVGFRTKFIIENEGSIFPHLWKVKEVAPYRKITLEWRYEGYEGDYEVSFELVDLNLESKLRLTHKVIENFPEDIPEFSRESCLGGWQYFISLRLRNYLEKFEQ